MNVAIKAGKDNKGQPSVKTGKVDRYRSGKAPNDLSEQEEEDFVLKMQSDPEKQQEEKAIESIHTIDRRLERLARNRSEQRQAEEAINSKEAKFLSSREFDKSKECVQLEKFDTSEKFPSSKESGQPENAAHSEKYALSEEFSQSATCLNESDKVQQYDEFSHLHPKQPQIDYSSSLAQEESSCCSEASEEDAPLYVPKANRTQQPQMIEKLSSDSAQIFQAYQSLQQQQSTDNAKNAHDPLSIDDNDAEEDDELAKEQEFLAWKQRQFTRMQRDKRQAEELTAQQAELAAFRALPSAIQQQVFDSKKALETEEAANKTKYKFLQKYYHKGAFFQDDDSAILQRDYNLATVGEQFDKTLLPQAMQVKSFGKKGRSKWTHLTQEDTTAFDASWGDKKLSIGYKMMQKMGGMRQDNSLEKRQKTE